MKSLRNLAAFVVLSALALSASAQSVLLRNVAATGAGAAVYGKTHTAKTYQASCLTASGSGSAVVNVEGSNETAAPDASPNWDVIVTITLTCGTTSTSNGQTSFDQYKWVRGNVTTLTGTGATASLIMGYGD